MSATIQSRRAAFAAALIALLACGGSSDSAPGSTATDTKAPGGAPAVRLTGKVHTIEMTTDEKGNYFTPNELEAHRGDVLRFTLKAGVHNVHFVPDSNPGRTGLPPVSDFLQLPGQTWDLTVSMPPGHYVFVCDPHAALGMVAKLEVEDEKN